MEPIERFTNQDVAIVIPVYKKELNHSEIFSLNILNKKMANYIKILVAPYSLDTTNYPLNKNYQIKRFTDNFFKSLKGYNNLLLSRIFYDAFIKYKYILIYQTDAIIFSDELLFWCNKNYDYIGAPWINEPFKMILYVAKKCSLNDAFNMWKDWHLRYSVGNGGLSLRKVDSFLSCFDFANVEHFDWPANEDYFWSFFAKNQNGFLKKPDYLEAINFSIEKRPSFCMKLNGYKLPFGIHAFEKHNPAFWKPWLENF